MVRVKIIQLAVNDDEDRAGRFSRVEKFLEQINAENSRPDLIMLPEIWGTGFFNFDRYIDESEPLQGETFNRLAPWAEKIGVYFMAGSIVERDGSEYYNTTLLIGPGGTLAGSYRKIHLFGYRSQESAILTAGNELYVLKTRYGTWGISTCYDLRFPELYRQMVDCGVDTILVTAAWPLARLEHWVLLNRTRALENLCYLVSCNCTGSLKGTALGGNSMVVDPWGEIVAAAGQEEEVLTVEIDRDRLETIRNEFPALQDRRIR